MHRGKAVLEFLLQLTLVTTNLAFDNRQVECVKTIFIPKPPLRAL